MGDFSSATTLPARPATGWGGSGTLPHLQAAWSSGARERNEWGGDSVSGTQVGSPRRCPGVPGGGLRKEHARIPHC